MHCKSCVKRHNVHVTLQHLDMAVHYFPLNVCLLLDFVYLWILSFTAREIALLFLGALLFWKSIQVLMKHQITHDPYN